MDTVSYDIKNLLKRHKLQPNSVLGQNFLLDDELIKKIVDTAGVTASSLVLEIGPGVGNWTREILARGAKVLAIEKDKSFAPILEALSKEFPGSLSVFYGDALKVINPSMVFPKEWGKEEYKVLGNIPYYITGKLMPLLFLLKPLPSEITLMVQKEVAERMVAGPGQMSLLALACQLKSDAKLEFFVPSKAFYPKPKVDSGIVKLEIRNGKLGTGSPDSEKKIFKLAKAAFLGKRKTLLNSLSSNLGLSKFAVEKALVDAQIDPKTRPQELSIQQWLDLTKTIGL